ncbi:MAG: hypothetical protein Fur0018_02420 [Anaerolineales bacterium]
MLTFRQLVKGLEKLEIPRDRPVMVHASLSAFGEVHGGADTLLGAILVVAPRVMMPAFTYRTMIVPEIGPPDNGITYGEGHDRNLMAEFFRPDMPVDPLIGRVAEKLRQHPRAVRSAHPILSFVGIGVDEALKAQTLQEPLAPVRVLTESQGSVLLLGVGQTSNTSIHYAEKLAGRKQFVRWALTTHGVVQCPGFPGSSDGFEQITPYLNDVTRREEIGMATVQAIPLPDLIATARRLMQSDPRALLPLHSNDLRVRDALRAAGKA